MRCLTLADAFKAYGAHSTFLCAEVPDALAALVGSHGHDLQRLKTAAPRESCATSQAEDAVVTIAALGSGGCDWLVVDHYGLDIAWEQRLRPSVARVLVIDDLADRRHDCDVLLDQNLVNEGKPRHAGGVPENCQLLLGPRFALLRDEFRIHRLQTRSRSGPVRRILVFFGGADVGNHTALAVEALRRLEPCEAFVEVVIGAEHPHRRALESACRREHFGLHIQTARMAEFMSEADLAIGAGGSATWERCCLGLPSLALALADNQLRVVRDAARAGLLYALEAAGLDAEKLARHLRTVIENSSLRESMSCAGMALVDGRGSARVLRSLGFSGVEMRRAVAEDAQNLFEWRNRPMVRDASRSKQPLDWANHIRWLESVLQDPARVLLIGESGGQPAGVVRFDIQNGVAEVSIYTVPRCSPSIRGADVLAAAEQWLTRNRPEVRELTAEVLGGNAVSHGLFVGAGFDQSTSIYTKRVR
jgi:UDP-2,4-diacetamido-2,4,6-trideoxy-beta-L-altropyranose hydrolase